MLVASFAHRFYGKCVISPLGIAVQEIITGLGHSSAVDWWALGKHFFHGHSLSLLQFPNHSNLTSCRDFCTGRDPNLRNAVWSNTIPREKSTKDIHQCAPKRPHLPDKHSGKHTCATVNAGPSAT